MTRTRWTIAFEAEGDGPPVEVRVRRLLKAALRSFGLRCRDVRETQERTIGDNDKPVVVQTHQTQ